jgi:hypothetical protein
VKDAHDRYANIETSYLLQRMEAYDGVTILATNLRANLDEAFTRRLHGVIDFPFPDAAQRLRIWHALFPATLPVAADVDLEFLARRYKIAGGSIRNVLVGAAYFAHGAPAARHPPRAAEAGPPDRRARFCGGRVSGGAAACTMVAHTGCLCRSSAYIPVDMERIARYTRTIHGGHFCRWRAIPAM